MNVHFSGGKKPHHFHYVLKRGCDHSPKRLRTTVIQTSLLTPDVEIKLFKISIFHTSDSEIYSQSIISPKLVLCFLCSLQYTASKNTLNSSLYPFLLPSHFCASIIYSPNSFSKSPPPFSQNHYCTNSNNNCLISPSREV